MESISGYIERLLWLIYRVFFVFLFPCVFIISLYLTLSYLHQSNHHIFLNIELFYNKIAQWSSFFKFTIFLGLCLIANLVIESFSEYYLSVDHIVNEKIEIDEFYLKFKENIQAKIKRKYSSNSEITASEISYIMRFKFMQNYTSFNNYYWYLYMNYKLSINLACFLLFSVSFYSPLLILIRYNLNMKNAIMYFFVQFILIGIHITMSRLFMDRDPEYNFKDAAKQINSFLDKVSTRSALKIQYFCLELLAIASLWIYTILHQPALLLIAINLSFYPVFCLLLRFSYHYRSIGKSVAVDAYISLDEQ